MNLFDFSISSLPRIIFSRGAIKKLPELCLLYGKSVLLVTGGQSFESSIAYSQLCSAFKERKIQLSKCNVASEPSPELVDNIVNEFREQAIDVVLGIGGGSALDAAKAIAGLLKLNNSVTDFLEGVGPELDYPGPAVPFIAVPTTAGTGSEATKNAVLSVQGKAGFKKSFRDDRLVAAYAVIDPELLSTCPKNMVAANGMDALTQLIEAYVSTRANNMTDALAISGLRSVRDSLLPMYGHVINDQAQDKMAYGSLMSGICLVQTGLGSVHGLASPLGAFYPIPHGVVCGTLVAEATDINIQGMLEREPTNPALDKYAMLGDVISGKQHKNKHESWEVLCATLRHWTEEMQLPRLGEYGVTERELSMIVENSRGSSMKTNPIAMKDVEICDLLLRRL
ncbi:Alcohol dehydrogenase [hydrothermal vent metagenome]|uniref:Alcohol dehydrogenase n=1 Tax=hydrothermal vent metagenome TaxID=652676 RepID=A0A3B0XA84_9ZZZZ